ncbi:Mu transposase C-terminal domain-containing protein [Janthinobacterium sp.]|uniref:Mu transposase C-terminal domain-containing protein n=1 Tax=Janthinobacterium sp. TaxID=1871054 RepID=UPI00293D5FBA|nr:Mu transposase C-terminal domain-containing protein [Janthinobacterium sp.]
MSSSSKKTASSALKAVNVVIAYRCADEVRDRVLWLCPDRDIAAVIRLSDDAALPRLEPVSAIEAAIHSGAASVENSGPGLDEVMPSESFRKKHDAKRRLAWGLIESLVQDEPNIYDERNRGPLIDAACSEKGSTKPTIYKLLRRFWQGGKIEAALYPRYQQSGGRGKIKASSPGKKRGSPSLRNQLEDAPPGLNVSAEMHTWIRDSVKWIRPGFTFADAHQTLLEHRFSKGVRIQNGVPKPILLAPSKRITYQQYNYWLKKLVDTDTLNRARYGPQSATLRHRAILGRADLRAFGPGSIFEIDVTIADVYLVSSINRDLVIGRPVLYVVIDVFSRLIVGLHVGFDGPNYEGAMQALANAASDKREYCSRFGIDILDEQWPCRYLPGEIYADGGELVSHISNAIADGLHITVANAPPYRGDWKPFVEGIFHITKEKFIKWTPGAVIQRNKERGKKPPADAAALTLSEFITKLIHGILWYNNERKLPDIPRDILLLAEMVEATPSQLWQWGIENRTGALCERSEAMVRACLLPRGNAKVTKKGLRFGERYYSNARAIREQWFEKARQSAGREIEVIYDRREIEKIYWQPPGSSVLESFHLLPKEKMFAHCSHEEVIDFFTYQSLRKQDSKDKEAQSLSDLHAEHRAIDQKAIAMQKKEPGPRPSTHAKTKGLSDRRAVAKQKERKDDAWHFGDSGEANKGKSESSPAKTSADVSLADSPDVPPSPKRASYSELLRKQQQARFGKKGP